MICAILKMPSNGKLDGYRIRAFWPHIERLYTLSKNSKLHSRYSSLQHAADLFQSRNTCNEEFKCLNFLIQDAEIEGLLRPCNAGLLHARLGRLLLARNDTITAEEWLRKAVKITLDRHEGGAKKKHWPELVKDTISVWDQLGKLETTMLLAYRLVENRLSVHKDESQDTIDAVRTWSEACLKLCTADRPDIVGLHDLEKLTTLSYSRLGHADELSMRSRCTLVGLQLQLPEFQKKRAFVQGAMTISEQVLGNGSPQSGLARQFLAKIQRREEDLQARRVWQENERARENEIQRMHPTPTICRRPPWDRMRFFLSILKNREKPQRGALIAYSLCKRCQQRESI